MRSKILVEKLTGKKVRKNNAKTITKGAQMGGGGYEEYRIKQRVEF